jgi:hypothetical protein
MKSTNNQQPTTHFICLFVKKILILSLFLPFQLLSQKYELGKVTVEELSEKVHPKDSAAAAAILFNKGDVKYEYTQDGGFQMLVKVMYKIKVYKKEGYDWANHSEEYYIGGGVKENVIFSDAVTYNLVDGKVEKTKLKSNGEFDEKINKFWGRKKITMPNVKEGSIIEFQYLIKTDRITKIPDWDFQTSIPVNYSEFKTYIPEYFVYNLNQKGFLFPKKAVDSKQRTIDYSYVKDFDAGMAGNNTATNRVNNTLDFTEQITTHTLSDIPALIDEAFVNNIGNYTATLCHELSVLKYPNSPIKSLSTDWVTVTKNIYENENFGDELNKTGYFEEDVKTILTGLTSNEEKIATLFNFVKSKVKWDDFLGYYCNEGVKNAYKKGTGNVAEINLMLTAMLRHAGIQANPVLLSTRSNGIALFPNRTAYNYVISGVETDSGLILLDATNNYALPNVLPIRDLNWVGRMIRKDGSSAEVDLMPKAISKDVVNLIATISSDGNIEGKVKEQYFDYNGFVFRSLNGNLNTESQIERLEKRHKGSEVNEYVLTNTSELTLPIVETYNFNHTNSVEIIGDKMYFSPLLFFALTENPFKQEKREYPIDFSYPKQDKYLINITIPDGYTVETLPQSVSVPMSDTNGSLKYMINNKEKQIQLSVTLDINTAIISSDYYTELKAFFAEVVKKETEKVVLKKI